MKRSALLVAGALGLAGAFFAGAAYATDPKLDEATELIGKAVAAPKSAHAPDSKKESGRHRTATVELAPKNPKSPTPKG